MTPAIVTLEEAVGSGQDTVDLTGYLHLLGADDHSGSAATSYNSYPLDGTGQTTTVYSCERWIRARFQGNFIDVRSFRFVAPTLAQPANGWSFKMGTATQYATPSTGVSTIAVTPLPVADPGRANPNAGGATTVVGDGTTTYSDWIVIQATVDLSTVDGSGPVYGYTVGGVPVLIEYDFLWTESE